VSRRAVFWTVVVLAGALVLAVVGVLVYSFANAEELIEDAGSELAAYLMIFGLVFADAIVPIFPGETTLKCRVGAGLPGQAPARARHARRRTRGRSRR
jgi:uncharacterized membrane protein YdjX (TVP38/TMEM64 family)